MAKQKNNERDSRGIQAQQKGQTPQPAQQPPATPAQRPAGTAKSGPAPAASAPLSPAPPARVAPLFRTIDWLTLLVSFAVVFVIYCLTIAPELTLEDSGELVTGSLYAGIPHPPGYPVWTIYSWLWTKLVPWGNMAWRVALAEAFLGALACGLLSLIVSRGSSMLMEGIEDLKDMTGRWESAICMVSGFVAGLLMGLDGFMWKESVAVNRIAVSSVPWFLIVLVCILRWLYAPHQYRFLYWALFVFGICFTTHQSLLVASIGIEIAIAAVNPRLGRDVFFGNFVIYSVAVTYHLATDQYIFSNLGKDAIQVIFHSVGIGSLAASLWLALVSKTKGIEIGRNVVALFIFVGIEMMALKKEDSGLATFYGLVAIGSLAGFIYLAWKTWQFSREWLHVVILGGLWILGFSFYFYEAVAGMTNPPMQWGYPRTVEGWFHALSRGQYEQPNPTNLLTEPGRFLGQLWMLGQGVADEYTWAYMVIALVPFLFYFRLQKRERAWLIGLTAIYFFIGVFLVILFNPTPDRASVDLVKVFFCNSHSIVACLIGYGLALTAAFMATHYQLFRPWGLLGGTGVVVLAIFWLWDDTGKHYFGRAGWPSISYGLSNCLHWIAQAFAKNQFGLPIFGDLVLVAVPVVFVCALLLYRNRGPLFVTLGLFLAMPLYSGLAHWYASDQRNHYFGYWFGHDMFTPPFNGADGKPLYPEMTKDAVLYGGTDPGRFCPTYMIFCESFTPHDCQPLQDQHFDRRDVYIITQNALADGTYLNYIRAHYNRGKQYDPPFFQDFVRSAKEKELNYQTNVLARILSPLDTIFEGLGDKVEKQRRTYTSWFTEKDFIDLPAFTARLRGNPQSDPLSQYLADNLSPETRQLLNGGNETLLRQKLAHDLNVLLERELQIKKRLKAKQQEKSALDEQLTLGGSSDSLRQKQQQLAQGITELAKVGPLYDAERFKQVPISEYLQDFIRENPQSHTRIRLNRLLLEAAYPKEIAKSLGGVYPDREIYIATPEDSQRCFNDYYGDAQKRLQHDMQFPNEPRQIKPGEDIKILENRLTVSGQTAVMAINGLLTKVMFDANPKNEFFVEESFPLDWMYPHLTPYGIIMKINRQPLPSLSEDVLQRDHQFWKQFSNRLTGDFIDYDTPLKTVCDWIEKTYLRWDFNGFTGDRKFIHDDDGQKSFSKLRSSIGGVYAWRLNPGCPAEYRPKSDAEFQRLFKEADFTFKQAFAFCPFSPEAVYRYANLLLQVNRIDDAILVAETCLKLDPFNGQVMHLLSDLRTFKNQASVMQTRNSLQMLEDEVHKHPTNFQAATELARILFQIQQTDRAVQLLDGVLADPHVTPNAVAQVASTFYQMQNWPKMESALERLVQVSPDSPEAWYNVAAFKANMNKAQEALPALAQALALSARRRQTDPSKPDLLADVRTNKSFASLRDLPEFAKLVPPK
jgi:tetratricopeptide (TPR) repeat protein